MRVQNEEPAEIVREQAGLLRRNPVAGPVLDLACGGGRNAVFLAGLGCAVEGLDRSAETLAGAAALAARRGVSVRWRQGDLEAPDALLAELLPAGAYAAVVVVKYLHRPLIPWIKEALRPGGLVVYETFTVRQREISGAPSNPAFLLEPGELRRLFADFEFITGFEGLRENPPRHVEAYVGRKPPQPSAPDVSGPR